MSLSGTTGNEIIRYTLDASEPNENSLVYSEPIYINETTIVRAKVFEEGYIPSYTHSRAFIYNVNHTLPIISLITDPSNLFDNDFGIYVFGDSYDHNYPHFGANFGKIGKDQFISHYIKIILTMRLALMLELRYLEVGAEGKLKDLFQFLQEGNMELQKLIISYFLSWIIQSFSHLF